MVDHGQYPVQALHGEGNRVKGFERREQGALPCQVLGRTARERHLVRQREPACPGQRDHRFVRAALFGECRLVDQVHEEAGAAWRSGYPYDASSYGERTGGEAPCQTGLGQRSRTRTVTRKARERVRNRGHPGIGLFRQLRRIDFGQQGCRQALQNGAR